MRGARGFGLVLVFGFALASCGQTPAPALTVTVCADTVAALNAAPRYAKFGMICAFQARVDRCRAEGLL